MNAVGVPGWRPRVAPARGAAVAAGVLVAALVAAGVGALRLDAASRQSAALASRLRLQESENASGRRDLAPLLTAAAEADAAASDYAGRARTELLGATTLLARVEQSVNASLGSRHEEAAALAAEAAAVRAGWESTPAETDAAASAYAHARARHPGS